MRKMAILPIDREIYSRMYQIHSPDLNGNTVYVYAECYRTPRPQHPNEYYSLDLFFSVADYGNKDHLIGLFFGSSSMAKADIDQEIDAFVDSQIDDLFFVLVQNYIEKEEMWEDELLRRDL